MSTAGSISGSSGGSSEEGAGCPPSPAAREAALEFDPSWILFQGSGVLAVNKPAGIPVHKGTSHDLGLAEMIDEWVRWNPKVLDIKGGTAVRPAHRLDLEASGVLLFALTTSSARKIQDALAAYSIQKRYLALVSGPVEAIGLVRGKVRSKLRGAYRKLQSEIEFRKLAGDERLSLVEVIPKEGRTHQIRALFSQAGRPLAGDIRYGKPKPARQFLEKFAAPCLLLHAHELTLPESVLGASKTIRAPLPGHFLRVLEKKGWSGLFAHAQESR